MNNHEDKDYVFNFKLSKFIGLYQILDPKATKIYNYNVYHIIGVFLSAYITIILSVGPYGLYYLMNDAVAFSFYFGIVENFLFSVYKVLIIIYFSDDLWKCIINTNFNMMSYRRYNRNILEHWQKRCLRVALMYVITVCFSALIWTSNPFFYNETMVSVKNIDGSYTIYRLNILNVYFPISNEIYNTYFHLFYFVETVFLDLFFLFTMLYDILTVMICYTLVCQLETINDGFQTLGHSKDKHYNIDDKILLEKDCDVISDLKKIIIDHQNIIKNLNTYYDISRSIMLIQIFISSNSHILIWFILAKSYFGGGEMGDSIISAKLMFVLPVFIFQLFMTCYLFGLIKEKKDSIILALYSSNWTLMNMKSKQLILLMMKMNNANQIKMQFTQFRIVNLEMFTNTMRMCYTVFSMLVNYNKQKN